MWPYSGKKMGRLELSGCNPYMIAPRGGEPNKEYFGKINSSVHKFNYFSAYHVENDGRVLKNQGFELKDVTNEICTIEPLEKRTNEPEKQQSRQLHKRNVTQLKFALDMPDKQRKASLSHITGAIIRNEVAPTLKQLQDVDFVRNNLSNERVLPPLRRKSLDKAKNLEKTAVTHQRRRPSICQLLAKSEPENLTVFLPSLGNSLSQTNTDRGSAVHHQTRTVKDVANRKRGNGPHQSDMPGSEEQERDQKVYETAMATGLRRDTVGNISSEISDQFKHIMMMSKARAEETDRSQARAMHIAGNVPGVEEMTSGSMYEKSDVASYKRRHEYGKNLEKNWFKSFIQKNKKKQTKPKPEKAYDMRLDIFYSPEPEADEDYENTEENDTYDDASMQCGDFSSATAEHKFRRQNLTKRASGDELLQDDNGVGVNSDDEFSSGSDIEIILKDDQLIQRRTKHKMRKKRKRQLERYKAFMPSKMETVNEGREDNEVTLTDQEIRAIRLNLRNKERMKKLKGKRKFLQAANAVYIAIQFKNILQKIRKRKLREIRKRQLKVAAMIAKRLRWKDKANNPDENNPHSTPQPSLKDVFLNSVGNKLIYDVESLGLLNEVEEVDEDSNYIDNSANVELIAETKTAIKVHKTCRYERELRSVSLRDIEAAFPSHQRPEMWSKKRRNSIPVSVKPAEFILEIQEKSKRRIKERQKPEHTRSISRILSPPVRKCACFRHRMAEQGNSHASACQHQQEPKKPKTKIIKIPTTGLMRTFSLCDLSKKTPIELRDLLEGIDIPAKEVKLEILARKFRKQRKKRQQIRLDPYVTPTESIHQGSEQGNDSDSAISDTDDSDLSDYDFIYGGPFVGSGVMWNQNTSDNRQRNWTAEDVDRELKRITRIYHDMKECRYLRMDTFNQAILGRLRENSF